jgi:hypothetical protein
MKRARASLFLGIVFVASGHGPRAGAAETPGGSAVAAAPADLAVSVVGGRRPVRALVNLTSAAGGDVRVSLEGEGAAFFRVLPDPSGPLRLRPHQALPLSLEVRAPRGTAPGAHHARLTFMVGQAPSRGSVALTALVVSESAPEHEPPLQDVISAMGLGTNVGSNAFAMGIAPKPLGDEVMRGWFRRAHAGPVSVSPLACFTGPTGARRFGYRLRRKPANQLVGTNDVAQNQTLRPAFNGGLRQTTFDPGKEPFALWLARGEAYYYSADPLNGGVHAARIYPVKDAAGVQAPDRWLVTLEEGDDGDYQDLVLLVSNVRPVADKGR